MGLPVCSVCGQPCGEYCTAIDEFGNPAGEWVHIICSAQKGPDGDTDYFGSLASTGIFKQKKAAVHKMRLPYRRVGTPIRSPLHQMPRLTVEIHKGKGCHRL